MKKIVAIAVLLTAAIAFGTSEIAYDLYAKFKPALFFKGIYIGENLGIRQVNSDTQNKITASYGQLINYDFPVVEASGVANLNIKHGHTPAFWVDGGQVGDICLVATNVTVADGGLFDDVWFDCTVVTPNRVVVRYHHSASDGGLVDIGDAGYYIRLFSNSTQH